MATLERSNPIPEPDSLVDSAEARELAARRPNSIIAWHGSDDDFQGGGYRIRLVAPAKWEVTLRGKLLTTASRRSSAFSIVEHHRRETLRRRDLLTWAAVAVLAVAAAVFLNEYAERTLAGLWVLLGFLTFFVGAVAVVRFFAILGRNLDDPYRRSLPWERVSWWQRFRG